MGLRLYWVRFQQLCVRVWHRDVTHFIRKLMPRWLVVQALIKAAAPGKGIADAECVPDVPFMVVYKRWFDSDFPGHLPMTLNAPVVEPVKESRQDG